MTEKYTTPLQCMSDLRTGYFHGCVIWQSNDIKLCCFQTTLNNPMHFGLAVVLYL